MPSSWCPRKRVPTLPPRWASAARSVRRLAGRFDEYAKKYPELATQWDKCKRASCPTGWEQGLPTFPADAKGLATRVSGGKVLNGAGSQDPVAVGRGGRPGALDNDDAGFDGAGVFSDTSAGRNMHFGIREHGMASAANGMALSGLRPYVSTFLVFSDYLRPTLRLAAIMELPVIHVYTHDSIGVGEDGPTHQPVEHYAARGRSPVAVLPPGRRQRSQRNLSHRAQRRTNGRRP